jgi:histone deacetylase 6
MLLHSLSLKNEAKMLQHPENPRRLSTIIDVISNSGIKEKLELVTNFQEIDKNWIIKSGLSADYVEYVEDLWAFAGNKDSMKYFDTYYNKHTPRAAKLACQALKICVDRVLGEDSDLTKWKSSFAAVRPPGHHAGTKNRISGFCMFNNIAVGATYASYVLKNRINTPIQEPRILIFDWDVHHGDSTQRLFSKSKDVLFMSFHRHDYGVFFPGKSGAVENVGEGDAEGYCLNLAWNTRPGSDYRVSRD